jgi:hypothetical protein
MTTNAVNNLQILLPSFFEWVNMSGDADGGGDDHNVFDDILSLKGRNEESRPGSLGDEEEWHQSGDKVDEEEGDSDSFYSAYEEEYTDQTLEDTEEDHESSESHIYGHGNVEELFDEWGSRRKSSPDNLEESEPEEYEEQTEASDGLA